MADGSSKLMLGGSVGAAAIAVAMGLTTKWEGTKTVPYRDMIGKWTVCTGETRVPMRRYTLPECRAFLEKAIRSDFGMGVLRCTPVIQNSPYQLGAAISAAYNIGVPAWCSSTMARQFQAGDWYGACMAFASWNKAGGVVVTGLANRRNDEMRACLTLLPPERTLTPKVAS